MTMLLARVEFLGLDLSLRFLVQRGLAALAIVVGALIVHRVGVMAIRRSASPKYPFPEEVKVRADATRSLLLSIWRYVVLLGVLVALVTLLPATLHQALVLTAVIGIVIALTAHALLSDVVAGFSLLLEGQFGVGDRVRLSGPEVEGVVEGVGLRITVLRSSDGSRVFVPNGEITAVRVLAGAAAAKPEREDARRSRGRGRGRSRSSTRSSRPASERTAQTSSEQPASESSTDERSSDAEASPEARPAGRSGGGSRSGRSGSRGGSSRPRTRSSPAKSESSSAKPESSGAKPESSGAKPESSSEANESEPASKDEPERPARARGRAPSPKPETDSEDVLSESPWSIE